MDLVWHMLHNGRRLDSFTFATVLSACASVATLEHGMGAHACATRAGLVSDVVIGSALVDMYAKCGRIEYASRFFELMPLRNVYSWNSMISGYARHGDGHKALEMFSKMKLENQQPDHVTFIGVLSACSHVGLVSEGYDHFESMRKVYNLSPRIEHFSCMVDLLGRAGEFDKLQDFINGMPIKPNVLIWRTVLGACGRANGRLLDLGRRAAQMIMELEPQNAVNYVLLSNMYASGEKWEHMAQARHAMKAAAARKEAGCSWVTMKDGIHIFISGDKTHPDTDAIYEKLGELHGKIKAAGYVPQIRYALYDLELENKEEILSYHSERLAVAFVLMRKSELPIRIMKNLRVCGDCHSAFKYISAIVGRQIVLRDSNSFAYLEPTVGRRGGDTLLTFTKQADIGSKGAGRISNSCVSGFGGSLRAPPSSELRKQCKQGSVLNALAFVWFRSFAWYPRFAVVYSFIGSVFDPYSKDHIQKLKQMDHINLGTVSSVEIDVEL
ncbi:putative pentatricopeptide repeat-containing protein [Sesamum angolense]|uniref:Pentatricopeptide repeat-containing protein n=1 Tax=Sesamum angolense TaxID=2727404 RepID=A0AAE1WN39_9LAMI|nr:putative pentatricopeptide repeat-containing protein [Sesamum angolense]